MLENIFPDAARLKQQLAELQQESEEEQQACRREVMKLRDQLQQAYQERDEAHTEVQRLRETVEAATAAKVTIFDTFLLVMVTFYSPFSYRHREASELLDGIMFLM